MADTKQKPTLAVGFNLPTAIRAMLPNGRLLSSDGSVWLVRKAPLQPIADAKSTSDRIEAFLPLLAAYEELAAMAPVNMTRRAVARKNYRQTHMLMVNTPKVYVPQQGNKNAAFLKEVFPQEITEQRVLMLAVRLVDKIGGDGGMKAAVDSIVETLVAGNTPMSDFDTDERKVDAALARCGFSVPNQAEIHMANSWWNQGRFPDTVSLPHSDHMHIFSDTAAARMADDAGRNDCANWPHIPSHRSLTLAVLENFDFSFLSPSEVFANWAVGLLADGAVAISIRGNIEPAKVTRAELRRQRKRYLDDINERFQHGKMELAEQTEMEDVLRDVEDIYATQGGSPTIVDASVLVAFDGEVEDISTVGAGTSAQLRVMNLRQSQAMAEMMLCSHIRANPVLHDMPSQNIACSGIQSLSMVGDRTGALLGFTQRDRQPVLFDPKASTNEDVGPIAVHVGSTGSGKAIGTSQSLPTPSGWTTMGELEVGSKVIGRDGKPATVTYLAPIEDKPDMFRISFSDGQTIDADGNHQWVVSSFNDRNMVRGGKHRAAIENWDQAKTVMDALDAITLEYEPDHETTVKDLFDIVAQRIDNNPWNLSSAIHWSLRMMDCPYRNVTVENTQNRKKGEVVKTDPVKLLPTERSLRALIHKWTNVKGGNAARWAKTTKARLAATTAALESGDFAEHLMARDIVNLIKSHGDTDGLMPDMLRRMTTAAGIKSIGGFAEVRIPISGSNPTKTTKSLYPTALAIKSLSARLAQQYGEEMTLEAHERVMSTGEILSDGLLTNAGQSKFSIRLAKPLELPEVDLPIDPYVLGAWLGDGFTAAGIVCSEDAAIIDEISNVYPIRHRKVPSDNPNFVVCTFEGLANDLRTAGFKLKSGIADKHIPAAYLRASYDQRLALLQGLMDTDGHVDKNGACEFVQARVSLVEQVVELIRSLGIKTGPIASGPSHATVTLPDGTKERRPGNGKHRIVFTTDQPIFRLPRKLERLPAVLRETQKWLYITDIESIDPVPARCITVDSPDSTYLVGGFIPTHNTQMLLWKAVQYDNLGIPQIFVDPKALALDTRIPTPTGWTTMGEIAVGEQVIGRDGNPCNVVHKSRTFTADETRLYEFLLDDGQVIRADQNHMWVTRRDGGDWLELTTDQMLSLDTEGWALPATAPALNTGVGFLHDRRALLTEGLEGAGSLESGFWIIPVHRNDLVELARSLGFVVRPSQDVWSFAAAPGHDAALLPASGREHRILDIRLVDSEPAQCIRVDSPDHTYLVADFVPTHNTGSDHSQTIENVGGHVTSLDELASADGIFDPIRFSSTAAVGVELAVSMLSSIDPWGGEAKKFEVDLYRALSYGVNHGAQCIGEALDLAQKAKWANEALCQPIFRLAESSPTFRACVGIYPNGEALRVADGLTYIKTGGMHLELPEPGAMASASLTQRIGMALVRMMVFGSLMALEGRGGVIHLDEAWVFLGAGKDEVQRLGRLARSQNVTAELYTQRISDALEAKLDGYISRGTILPTADEFEARAALALFHIEATDDRVAAITAKGTIGGVDSVTPNWNSMRALRDPDTRKVLRGTIGIVSDLAGRAVPVHIKLPDVFLKLSSTTPSDIAARKKALASMSA